MPQFVFGQQPFPLPEPGPVGQFERLSRQISPSDKPVPPTTTTQSGGVVTIDQWAAAAAALAAAEERERQRLIGSDGTAIGRPDVARADP